MLTPDREVRPHWRDFIASLSALSPADLERRWELGQVLLRENGVTYNVHGDPDGLDRPWQLDPLPMLLPASEWRDISAAVGQRATLLNAMLADLYGERRLIGEGLLPPSLLHANPAFLRPCQGWSPVGGGHLRLYAADLARAADGRWWVVSDRCEAPSGTGYALENRIISARVLPEFFRAIPVERLKPFFDTLRQSLEALSPRRRETPRMVLLTPGPYNETYFEHAYLARHLGITLVQGEDLTVRDNTVYLKTLSGLQPVDVILRRTNGIWCDPLDLRGDSTLGVAGLVQAARAGNVGIANSLGSGVLEGCAVMAFLPGLARRLLGEELKLPSIATWWCGQQAERDYVLENLESLVIRPAFHNRRRPMLGDSLSAEARERLKDAIRTRPWDWVAQELGAMSTLPVWRDGGLQPQSVVLRVFAVADGAGGWKVMPGGLARVSAARDLLTTSLQGGGGGSKDIWVLADQPAGAVTVTTARVPPVKIVRGARDLPSRVADNMFWLGRYMERCESTTRLLRAALQRVEDALDSGEKDRAVAIARTMANLGLALPHPLPEGEADDLPEEIALYHLGNAGPSLKSTADRLQRVFMNLRDRLSVDTWRALQKLIHQVGKLGRGEIMSRLNKVVLTIEAVNGLSMENMTRGPLWQFMDSGRRLERAVHVVDMLAGAITDADGPGQVPLDLLLEVSDSVMTYRSRYLASPQLPPVLDLLLCDESNPRSLAFQLQALAAHADRLPRAQQTDPGFLTPEQRLMTVLCGIVRTTDVTVLAEPDADGGFRELERLFESLRSRLWELSEVLTREYFSHAQWRLPTFASRTEMLP